jgi:hypothetical protein
LLVVEHEPCAKTCASLVVRLHRTAVCARNLASPNEIEFQGWKVFSRSGPAIPPSSVVSHADLLRGLQLRAEVLRSWTQHKPVHSVGVQFELRAAQ